MVSEVSHPIILGVRKFEFVQHNGHSDVLGERRLSFLQKIPDHVSRSIVALDLFYLALELMNLVIHQVQIHVTIEITRTQVSIALSSMIIEPFSHVSIMQLVV